jgi:pyruvate carboxylase
MLTRIRQAFLVAQLAVKSRFAYMRACQPKLPVSVTIAIYSQEDPLLSLHRPRPTKRYLVGPSAKAPVDAISSTSRTSCASPVEAKADAIHPGYGFPFGEPRFRRSLQSRRRHLRRAHARDHAHARQQGGGAQSSYSAGVPVMPATPPLPADIETQGSMRRRSGTR